MNQFNSQRPLGRRGIKKEKMYVPEMLDLILFSDIGFPSYVARALYTF